jgi:toxin CptA
VCNRIDLSLSPSWAAGLVALLPWAVLAAFLLTAAGLGHIWLLVCLPLAAAGAIIHYRRLGRLRGSRAITALSVDGNRLTAHTAGGPIQVIPTASSHLGARFALLKLRPPGTRFRVYSVILLAPGHRYPGNVCPDRFRKFRQWLRLGLPGPIPTAAPEHP